MIKPSFWKGKKVFITGNTGFKGSWLSLWLTQMGAKVYGYALNPPTQPSLYELCHLEQLVETITGDIRDLSLLQQTMKRVDPEIVFHLAAQPLVRDSYKHPVETYAINVLGTVNLLETVRSCSSVRVIINVTTDKVYENKEWLWGYRESDPLGGYDPYSNSKACSELVTMSYRNSFFNPADYKTHRVGIATARAGNVIGGGDWASDRLVPDIIRALLKHETIVIRNPHSIRPWQHVLEPLAGYLILAERLWEHGDFYSETWNFGPDESDAQPVQWIVEKVCAQWHSESSYQVVADDGLHEATYLKLDCTKAKAKLGWYSRWNLETAIAKTIEWVQAYQNNENLRNVTLKQIQDYHSEEQLPWKVQDAAFATRR